MSSVEHPSLARLEHTGRGQGVETDTAPRGRVPGVLGVVLLPGMAMLRRAPLTGTLLLIAGVLAPFYACIALWMTRDRPTAWALDPTALTAFTAVGIAFIASRLVALALTYRSVRPTNLRRRLRWRGFAAVAVLSLPVAFVAVRFDQLRSLVDEVFVGEATDGPITPLAADTQASEYRTVLLLGGDDGPGRFGLRTDTMILLIIHHRSGRAAMVSIPRNLEGLRFTPGTPLAEEYPDGFDDLANAIYPLVHEDPELSAEYARDGLEPGALALMDALSYSMGITIDDYALVNMVGFVDIVDAVGGITIELDKEIPMPGNPPGAKHPVPASIGPGTIEMDGTIALGYVRSREADSDYDRMGRQRILLTEVSQSAGLSDLLTRLGDLSSALRSAIRTSMTVEEAKGVLGVVQDNGAALGSVGLVPPYLEPSDPDFDEIAAMITAVRSALAANTPVDAELAPFADETPTTTP